jgi:hypothetical protein
MQGLSTEANGPVMHAMRRSFILSWIPLWILCGAINAQELTSYRLRVPVDEVSLSFHVADRHGLAVNDLKLEELNLLDNGRPPEKITVFEPLQDASIRAGILMDTSESMREFLAGNRTISIEYAQRVLRQKTDQAFVMEFGYLSKVIQPWTGEPAVLAAGVRRVGAGRELGGTAMFDTIYRACFSEFGRIDRGATGNFACCFPTAKTMPATCLSRRPWTRVSGRIRRSTPFARSRRGAFSRVVRRRWLNLPRRLVGGCFMTTDRRQRSMRICASSKMICAINTG